MLPFIKVKMRGPLTPATFIGCAVPLILLNFAIWAGLIYIAVHFIRKVW